MAEIDKALPNSISDKIKFPNEKALQAEQQQQTADAMKEPANILENPDGSVDINFDPNAVEPIQGGDHFANLAELLPDDVLDPLGSQLATDYMEYKTSRKDWERAYTSGLDLLGFKYDDRSEPFKGASGATECATMSTPGLPRTTSTQSV